MSRIKCTQEIFTEEINKAIMAKILVLTSIYPGPGVPDFFTPVVHYFTREWIKMGQDVVVIHNSTYFPVPYYWAPKFVRRLVEKKFKCSLPLERLSNDISFDLDGVHVYRFPMFKLMPGTMFYHSEYQKQTDKIKRTLDAIGFKPDYIVSHWVNPQIMLSASLKEYYKCKTVLTLHDNGALIQKMPNPTMLVNNIDLWGYRSEKVGKDFEKLFGLQKRNFRCFSGIPSCFIKSSPKRNWDTIHNFIYVGALIERKHPDTLIKALSDYFSTQDYTLNIVGEGNYRPVLEELINDRSLNKHVHLLGRLKREDIIKYYDASDVFAMISSSEVFGLVYLEAMARGCIVIASKGGGMEGIVKDGINGFLCNPGDEVDFKRIIELIQNLPPESKSNISNKAMETAEQYTDQAAAKKYLDNILSI